MRKQLFTLAIVIGAGFAAPAIAQLHVAATSNPAPSLKNPAVAAPALPDAAKVVTKADAEAFADAEFAFADSDKSLNLTKAEFAALVKARDDKAKEAAEAPAGGATPPTPAATGAVPVGSAPLAKAPEAQFAEIAGKATQIDRTKFVEARLAAYAAADLDADGALTADEGQKFADLVAGKSPL